MLMLMLLIETPVPTITAAADGDSVGGAGGEDHEIPLATTDLFADHHNDQRAEAEPVASSRNLQQDYYVYVRLARLLLVWGVVGVDINLNPTYGWIPSRSRHCGSALLAVGNTNTKANSANLIPGYVTLASTRSIQVLGEYPDASNNRLVGHQVALDGGLSAISTRFTQLQGVYKIYIDEQAALRTTPCFCYAGVFDCSPRRPTRYYVYVRQKHGNKYLCGSAALAVGQTNTDEDSERLISGTTTLLSSVGGKGKVRIDVEGVALTHQVTFDKGFGAAKARSAKVSEEQVALSTQPCMCNKDEGTLDDCFVPIPGPIKKKETCGLKGKKCRGVGVGTCCMNKGLVCRRKKIKGKLVKMCTKRKKRTTCGLFGKVCSGKGVGSCCKGKGLVCRKKKIGQKVVRKCLKKKKKN